MAAHRRLRLGVSRRHRRPLRAIGLDRGVKGGAFARFGAAGGLSLGMAGATIMVAGAGCLLGAWVAARRRSLRLSTRCIKIPEATCGYFVNPSLFSGDGAVWLGSAGHQSNV